MRNKSHIHVSIDMMSGDFGLKTTVPAVLLALTQHAELFLILVGNKLEIQQALYTYDPNFETGKHKHRIAIIHSSQIVSMHDQPINALRKKPDSSMRVALNLVKTQQALACVSAGNTGALMIIAKYVLKTISGVDRPAILYPIPGKYGPVNVLDLGANIDCTAQQLYQFAVMGSILVAALENKAHPKIGLLNIGKENIKGTEAIKQANELIIKDHNLNYLGFIEGDDIYKSKVDVVVCDGFVGNVALKVSEGLAKLISHYLKQGFMQNYYTKFIAYLAKPILQKIFNKINPSKYNGANLLGLNGVVIKSHGGADAEAFNCAITAALLAAKKNVPALISEKVSLQLNSTTLKV